MSNPKSDVTAADVFQMIAAAARKYAELLGQPPELADQVMSWDEDHQFVLVIARGDSAASLIEHLEIEAKFEQPRQRH